MGGAKLCSFRHGKEGHSAGYHAGLRRLQGAKLYDAKESAKRSGAVRVKEVLSPVPRPYAASRDKVIW